MYYVFIYIGGTAAYLVGCNVQVNYLITTNGDRGWGKDYSMTSEELAIIREQEQLNAANVTGVSSVTFLHQEDGRLEGVDPIELKKNITKWIRFYRPDLVVTFSPEIDYDTYQFGLMHADHKRTGETVLNCVWPAIRDYLSFIDLFNDGYLPWIVPEVWLFSFSRRLTSIDTLLYLDQSLFTIKLKSLLEHKSQYDDAEDVEKDLKEQGSYVLKQSTGVTPSTPELAEAFQVIYIQ